jgi:hypothetical protein
MPQSCDMGQMALLPLRRKVCWGFFRPKYPTASAGFVSIFTEFIRLCFVNSKTTLSGQSNTTVFLSTVTCFGPLIYHHQARTHCHKNKQESNIPSGLCSSRDPTILQFNKIKYRCALVSTGNTFQDLPRLRESANNTERYISRDIRVIYVNR